jgi:hypothetical protein
MYDYTDRGSTTNYNKILDKISLVLTSVYITEGMLKIIAMGLVMHNKSYLRDMWNVFDLIVVVAG